MKYSLINKGSTNKSVPTIDRGLETKFSDWFRLSKEKDIEGPFIKRVPFSVHPQPWARHSVSSGGYESSMFSWMLLINGPKDTGSRSRTTATSSLAELSTGHRKQEVTQYAIHTAKRLSSTYSSSQEILTCVVRVDLDSVNFDKHRVTNLFEPKDSGQPRFLQPWTTAGCSLQWMF